MPHHSAEFKAEIVEKMMPPNSQSVAQSPVSGYPSPQ